MGDASGAPPSEPPGEAGTGGAIVEESALRWQLSSPIISFRPHDTTASGGELEVSCAIQDGSIEFTIVAASIEGAQTPASRIKVRRGNLAAKQCVVEVQEAPSFQDAAFDLADTCTGTDPQGGCVLDGAFDVNGWDFAGTLTCTKLLQQLGDMPMSLVDSVRSGGPVTIKLDRCDR